MKKIVALLLALMLCLGSFPAFAELDFSKFTNEELIYLRNQINKELLERGVEKEVVVPMGRYIVGIDIPAGTYTVRPYTSYGTFHLYVDEKAKYPFIGEVMAVRDNEYIGKVIFENGNVVELEGTSFVFSPYQGLGF
ncbi:MAG: hypothetical protein IKJ65_01985 [Clostridia bacterium]|nr:hypothetical protein [Clostridia bacterium]